MALGTLPRRLPSQRRSEATRAAILEAARRIIAADRSPSFTMARLAATAGVSVGSLYQYFRDREGVVAAIREAHFVELQRVLELEVPNALAEPSLGVAARRILVAMNARLAADAGVLSVVLRADPFGFAASTPLFDALREQIAITIRVALEQRRAELRVTDLEMAALVVARHISSATYGTLMVTPQHLEDPRMLDESVAMLVRYLTAA